MQLAVAGEDRVGLGTSRIPRQDRHDQRVVAWTIAVMPAFTAPGRSGQAVMRCCRSGSIRVLLVRLWVGVGQWSPQVLAGLSITESPDRL